MLGALRRKWAPEAFIISFKLETDEGLLISKVLITQLAMRFAGVECRSHSSSLPRGIYASNCFVSVIAYRQCEIADLRACSKAHMLQGYRFF